MPDSERSGGRKPPPAVMMPGAPPTIEELARRARRGQSLFHPTDDQDAARVGISAKQNKNSSQTRTGLVVDGAAPAIGFGARLREIRLQRKMSQRQLARRAGLDHKTVCKIESGRSRRPALETIEALAEALRLGLDVLLGRKVPVS